MSNSKKPKPSSGRESFLIFMVVGCGILATLSLNTMTKPDGSDVTKDNARPGSELAQKKDKPVALIDVPLSSGNEPLDKLFAQSGCAVCHTIPGIAPAKGRQGPKLVLGTNGPKRLEDPNYKGTAVSVREYIQESILNPWGLYCPRIC